MATVTKSDENFIDPFLLNFLKNLKESNNLKCFFILEYILDRDGKNSWREPILQTIQCMKSDATFFSKYDFDYECMSKASSFHPDFITAFTSLLQNFNISNPNPSWLSIVNEIIKQFDIDHRTINFEDVDKEMLSIDMNERINNHEKSMNTLKSNYQKIFRGVLRDKIAWGRIISVLAYFWMTCEAVEKKYEKYKESLYKFDWEKETQFTRAQVSVFLQTQPRAVHYVDWTYELLSDERVHQWIENNGGWENGIIKYYKEAIVNRREEVFHLLTGTSRSTSIMFCTLAVVGFSCLFWRYLCH